MNRRAIAVIVLIVLSMLIASCGKAPIKMQKSPLTIQGWMFPSDKSCDASAEIADGRRIDVLKPEYYNLQDNGTLTKLTAGCNAYSADNVALVKQYSTQQFVTISGNTAGMNALATSRNLTSAFLSEMYSFSKTSGFTGIELDFEGFGQWTPQQYSNYKALVGVIGNAMHAIKCKLMIDGPAISDDKYQSYYPNWRWEDFDNMPQVDFLTVMAYDQQADGGNGTPVASLSWLGNICQRMLSKIADHSRIIMGINSYGYSGRTGAYTAIKNTYNQSIQLPGFNTARRDPNSGEMVWTQGDTSYNYSDSTSLSLKLQAVLNSGISNVSVWHLGGGNPWFPQQAPMPTPSPVPTPSPTSITLSQDQLKAIIGTLSSDQVTTIKNIAGQQ